MVDHRQGAVHCMDVTPVQNREPETLLDLVIVSLRVQNVRFPAYTHATIHRPVDNSRVAVVGSEELTTVGGQNCTFLQQDSTWLGGVFFSGNLELRLFANKSERAGAVEEVALPLATSTPLNVSTGRREAMFTLPSFNDV